LALSVIDQSKIFHAINLWEILWISDFIVISNYVYLVETNDMHAFRNFCTMQDELRVRSRHFILWTSFQHQPIKFAKWYSGPDWLNLLDRRPLVLSSCLHFAKCSCDWHYRQAAFMLYYICIFHFVFKCTAMFEITFLFYSLDCIHVLCKTFM
jgi:hypothetical protein